MEDTAPGDRDDVGGATEGQEGGGPSAGTRHPALEHKLPLARVKRLIKAESDVGQLTAEAGALITKATVSCPLPPSCLDFVRWFKKIGAS